MPRLDGGSVVPSAEQERAIVEPEARLLMGWTVALKATLAKEGSDDLAEIRRDIGTRWECSRQQGAQDQPGTTGQHAGESTADARSGQSEAARDTQMCR